MITKITLAIALTLMASGCGSNAPAPDTKQDQKNDTAKAEKQTTPKIKPTEAAATDELGSLPDDIGIGVGNKSPEAEVTDFEGEAVSLSELVSQGRTILVFYRGGWCPFCNFQIRQLTAAYPDFRARGVTPIVISVDRPEESAKTHAAYEIPFPVLSDPDLSAHRAFRITHRVGDTELARLKGFGIDLERSSGRKHHTIAIPAIFIIDKKGVVRWAHANPNYKVRPTTDQLLKVLDGLGWAP